LVVHDGFLLVEQSQSPSLRQGSTDLAACHAAARKCLAWISLFGHDTLLDLHSQEDRWIGPQQSEDNSEGVGDVHVNVQGTFNGIPIVCECVIDLSLNPVQRFGDQQMLEDNAQDQVED
jgi:hypothetical protein